MAAISDLATLAVADVAAGDYLPIYDASAATDKKTPLFAAGTWTPVLGFGGATTGITYSTQAGQYVRIGALVMASCQIVLTSKGSATGSATITGLSVASVSEAVCTLRLSNMINEIFASVGGLTINLYGNAATATAYLASDADFDNDSTLSLTVIYEG